MVLIVSELFTLVSLTLSLFLSSFGGLSVFWLQTCPESLTIHDLILPSFSLYRGLYLKDFRSNSAFWEVQVSFVGASSAVYLLLINYTKIHQCI